MTAWPPIRSSDATAFDAALTSGNAEPTATAHPTVENIGKSFGESPTPIQSDGDIPSGSRARRIPAPLFKQGSLT